MVVVSPGRPTLKAPQYLEDKTGRTRGISPSISPSSRESIGGRPHRVLDVPRQLDQSLPVPFDPDKPAKDPQDALRDLVGRQPVDEIGNVADQD